ncbi:hypothetical protein AOLI_G00176310 [Acnodon oligacanthus]
MNWLAQCSYRTLARHENHKRPHKRASPLAPRLEAFQPSIQEAQRVNVTTVHPRSSTRRHTGPLFRTEVTPTGPAGGEAERMQRLSCGISYQESHGSNQHLSKQQGVVRERAVVPRTPLSGGPRRIHRGRVPQRCESNPTEDAVAARAGKAAFPNAAAM